MDARRLGGGPSAAIAAHVMPAVSAPAREPAPEPVAEGRLFPSPSPARARSILEHLQALRGPVAAALLGAAAIGVLTPTLALARGAPITSAAEIAAAAPSRTSDFDVVRARLPSSAQDHLDALRAGGKLEERGIAGGPTLLETLAAVARDAERELYALVVELTTADNAINQGNRGTCAVTAVSHDLAAHHPAEYARLVHALLARGEAELAGGGKLTLPPDALPDDGSERSLGERALQSALMQYAHPESPYHDAWATPIADGGGQGGVSRDGFDDREGGGISPEELVRVLDGVYGRPHTVYRGEGFFRSGADMLERARAGLDRPFAVNGSSRPAAVREASGPVLAFLDWGSIVHVVELERIDEARVTFRNPIGGPEPLRGGGEETLRVGPTGAHYASPSRRVESSTDARESMTLDDFADAVREVVLPR